MYSRNTLVYWKKAFQEPVKKTGKMEKFLDKPIIKCNTTNII